MGQMAFLPFRRKNPKTSAGFEPANLGTRGQHATSRPPKSLRHRQIYKQIIAWAVEKLYNRIFRLLYFALLLHSNWTDQFQGNMQSVFQELSPTIFQCKTIELNFKFDSKVSGRFHKPVEGLVRLTYCLCSCNNSQTAQRMVMKYFVGEFCEKSPSSFYYLDRTF